MPKSNKIRRIVRIQQMLRQWRKKARANANASSSDVPAGYVAVCVGAGCRRFVVRATYLNHPVFRGVLAQAEEEFGFGNVTGGPLRIPCDELEFEEILRLASSSSRSDSIGRRFLNLEEVRRCAHSCVFPRSGGREFIVGGGGESRPLLRG